MGKGTLLSLQHVIGKPEAKREDEGPGPSQDCLSSPPGRECGQPHLEVPQGVGEGDVEPTQSEVEELAPVVDRIDIDFQFEQLTEQEDGVELGTVVDKVET